MTAHNPTAPQTDRTAFADGQAGAANNNNSLESLRAASNGVPARVAEVPRAFPDVNLESAFPGSTVGPLAKLGTRLVTAFSGRREDDSGERRAANSNHRYHDDDEVGASGPNHRYHDDDDIGGPRPIKDDDDDGGGDDGGGNNRIANFISQFPFLGGILGMFSGVLSRSRSSSNGDGGCCSPSSRKMSTRVDGLSSQSHSNSYNMIMGMPGFRINADKPAGK